jgi:hypothetical protein
VIRKTLTVRVTSLERRLTAIERQRVSGAFNARRDIDALDRRTAVTIASIGEVDERLSNRITEVEDTGGKIATLKQELSAVKTEQAKSFNDVVRVHGRRIAELEATCKRKKRK